MPAACKAAHMHAFFEIYLDLGQAQSGCHGMPAMQPADSVAKLSFATVSPLCMQRFPR